MGPIIPKEMKYNLHYGKVREDILPPPHGTNACCSSKINVTKIAFGNKEHTTDKTLHKSHKKQVYYCVLNSREFNINAQLRSTFKRICMVKITLKLYTCQIKIYYVGICYNVSDPFIFLSV